jgi:hypothetical protein
LQQVDPPIRELVQYRDPTTEPRSWRNEPHRTRSCPKQFRLGGMAAVLETRLGQAQNEPLAPIDLTSCLRTLGLRRQHSRGAKN